MSNKRSQRNTKKYLTALRKKRAKLHAGGHTKPAGKSWSPHNPYDSANFAGHANVINSGGSQSGVSVMTSGGGGGADNGSDQTTAPEAPAGPSPLDTFIEETIAPEQQESFKSLPEEQQEQYQLGMSAKPKRPNIPNAKEGLAPSTLDDPNKVAMMTTAEDDIQKIKTNREKDTITVDANSGIGQAEIQKQTDPTTIANETPTLETNTIEAELTQEIVDDVGPPQGSAAKVLQQVDTANVPSSTDAGKDLESQGVDKATSQAIANDPEGALEQLEGTDLESRANIADLPEEALMSAQMNGLLAGMEEGKTPLWAKPAVDKVNAMLAARGMTASSIGQGALFNAIIQSAMPIAQDNARALQQRASEKLTAAVAFKRDEAQFEQQMKIANLSNEQEAYITKLKFKQESMISDQAAKNAAKQFNATSQNQTDQFMASLKNNINQYNASAENAMKQFNITEQNKMAALNAGNELAVRQFNVQQQNDMSKFYEQNELAREQFNATNAQAIEQSNIAWVRSINTAETAAINAANAMNVQNAFNMTTLEQTQMWQQMRDTASYIRDAYERDQDRKTTLFNTVMGNKGLMDNKSNANDTARMNYWSNWLEKLF